MWTGVIAEPPGQSFPEVLAGSGIIKNVSSAQDGVDAISAPDIENPVDNLHSRARELLLCLLRKGRKPPAQMPIGGVQDPQHDVTGFGAAIRNATWKRRVIFGARYRRS
jgi:hypothetical protein